MKIPVSRGPLSAALARSLAGGEPAPVVEPPAGPMLDDDDAQLALWMLFELHYRGFDDVLGDREWDPDLLRLRGALEARMEQELRDATAERLDEAPRTDDFAEDLFAFVAADDAPSVAAYIHRHAGREQVLQFLATRSLYTLKESDAHSFVLGRLDGQPKTALAEIQYDEYGSGSPSRSHAGLFARALAACGLDASYGAYLHETPVEVLAQNNLHSLFGFRWRLRGAAMGLLATFEITSSVPCRKVAAGIERVDLPEEAAAYFHEHVEADAVHEQVAARDICGSLVASEPSLREDVLFGAAACLHLDGVAGRRMLDRWGAAVRA